MTKTDFYQNLRTKISTIYNTMADAKRMSEFLNTMDADTLDNMGVPDAGVDEGLRTALSQLRTALNEFNNFFDGTATTQTYVLKDLINELRYI